MLGHYYSAVNSYFDIQIIFLMLVVKSYRQALCEENMLLFNFMTDLKLLGEKLKTVPLPSFSH